MSLALRRVCLEDRELLYRWANDPVTRQNAFHSEPIPYERHRQWFADALKDQSVVIYICMDEDEAVGQLRVNISNGEALISYSVDANRRGSGVGSELLRLAELRLREEYPEIRSFKAEVKYGNIASAKVFDRNGYSREDRAEYIVFYKDCYRPLVTP